jgi:hypothetical protein
VLATVLEQSVGHLYVAPADEPNSLRQVTRGSRERVGAVDADASSVVFQRTPDGQKWELWACEHDGNDLRRFNTEGPEVVRDLRGISVVEGEILFTARGPDNLRQIWRVDFSGRPPLQLTATENGAYGPSLAPDGTWFVYIQRGSVGSLGMDDEVWKQPTGGGDPVLLSTNASSPVISPDGANVAITAWRPDNHGFLHEIIPAEGGAPVISFDLQDQGFIPQLRWRPDDKALTYVVLDGQVWRQPLDGGSPQQLTHFDHGLTVSHAWSPDGKRLYLAREETTRDAVLIRDFQ